MNELRTPSAGGRAGPPASPTVVLYGRPGCHLCEDALTVIEQTRRTVAFTLEQVYIERDAQLLKRYLERIPVIMIDGREAFELFVDQAQLIAALERPERGSGSQ